MKINLLVVISLMVVMSAAIVAPVMAATTGTSEITGNPGAAIDIGVTGSITGWALAVGSNTDSSSVSLTVSSNKLGWTVAVKDAMDDSKISGTEGKMANWTGSAYAASGNLAAAMHVIGASVPSKTTGADRALSGSDQLIETGLDVVSSQSMGITIGQAVAYTDPRVPGSNVYRMIVTFTGSVA